MTQTVKTARTAAVTKTPSEVQGMLLDIATVLRLTAMVKAEMVRERAEADRQTIENRRAACLGQVAVTA